MYNIDENCEYRSCGTVSSIESKEERMLGVCQIYSLTEEEVRRDLNIVSIAVLLNCYFEFLFQKPLLDCRPKEVAELRNSESRYYAWRKKKTPSFEKVLEVLDLILPKL